MSSNRNNQSMKRMKQNSPRRKKGAKNDENDVKVAEVDAAHRFYHRVKIEKDDV